MLFAAMENIQESAVVVAFSPGEDQAKSSFYGHRDKETRPEMMTNTAFTLEG